MHFLRLSDRYGKLAVTSLPPFHPFAFVPGIYPLIPWIFCKRWSKITDLIKNKPF